MLILGMGIVLIICAIIFYRKFLLNQYLGNKIMRRRRNIQLIIINFGIMSIVFSLILGLSSTLNNNSKTILDLNEDKVISKKAEYGLVLTEDGKYQDLFIIQDDEIFILSDEVACIESEYDNIIVTKTKVKFKQELLYIVYPQNYYTLNVPDGDYTINSFTTSISLD